MPSRVGTRGQGDGNGIIEGYDIVMVLAQALQVSADELLGLKPASKTAQAVAMDDDPETRRLWKRFQMVTQLPEKDQRAVIRLINSLAAVAPRRNGSQEDHDGR